MTFLLSSVVFLALLVSALALIPPYPNPPTAFNYVAQAGASFPLTILNDESTSFVFSGSPQSATSQSGTVLPKWYSLTDAGFGLNLNNVGPNPVPQYVSVSINGLYLGTPYTCTIGSVTITDSGNDVCTITPINPICITDPTTFFITANFTADTTTNDCASSVTDMNNFVAHLTVTPLITSNALTTQPLTTQPLTTAALTTQALTTQALTTQALTTQALTTQPLTTSPVTSSSLTTAGAQVCPSPRQHHLLENSAICTSPRPDAEQCVKMERLFYDPAFGKVSTEVVDCVKLHNHDHVNCHATRWHFDGEESERSFDQSHAAALDDPEHKSHDEENRHFHPHFLYYKQQFCFTRSTCSSSITERLGEHDKCIRYYRVKLEVDGCPEVISKVIVPFNPHSIDDRVRECRATSDLE